MWLILFMDDHQCGNIRNLKNKNTQYMDSCFKHSCSLLICFHLKVIIVQQMVLKFPLAIVKEPKDFFLKKGNL
jgi:hypothetical protein